jgi:hypothetical protein
MSRPSLCLVYFTKRKLIMSLEQIIVSDNKRFLTTRSGAPFFWLGDTAWELFHRLTFAETETYLETRRKQGYNVIQAVALAELDGFAPNANGHIPLLGNDPTRLNEYYFLYVDKVIRLAAEKGMYIALLPTWADKVVPSMWGVGPGIFTVENARIYGKLLGQRYRSDSNILWVLGGDRPGAGYEALWTAMAEGIVEGLGYRPFFTFHPPGGASSSVWLHDADWLDMNMWQSGHVLLDTPTWDNITNDYNRTPPKPTLDGEPNYEDHPIDPFMRKWTPDLGRYTEYDVRKQAYRAVFAGACGHTYGHHSVWQFWDMKRAPINFPMPEWQEAIHRPGAAQMMHLKNLMLSRPYLTRIPAQDMLPDVQNTPPVGDLNEDRINPRRVEHARATRCAEGTYAMVYFPLAEQTLRVDLSALTGEITAWWYDPRSGKAHPAGKHGSGVVAFTSPIAGPDWVLVLDSSGQNFAVPGAS